MCTHTVHGALGSEGCVCSLRSRFSLTLHYRGRSCRSRSRDSEARNAKWGVLSKAKFARRLKFVQRSGSPGLRWGLPSLSLFFSLSPSREGEWQCHSFPRAFLRLTLLFHRRHTRLLLLFHHLLTSVSFLKKGNKVLKF